jgi:hypothetical protein
MARRGRFNCGRRVGVIILGYRVFGELRVLGRGRDSSRYGNQFRILVDRGWSRVYMGAGCELVHGGGGSKVRHGKGKEGRGGGVVEVVVVVVVGK